MPTTRASLCRASEANIANFDAVVNVTRQAVLDHLMGKDPTHGAYFFNMRTAHQAAHDADFQGATSHTVDGPYHSPNPLHVRSYLRRSPMNVRKLIPIIALFVIGASSQAQERLTSSDIGNVLQCLDTKLSGIGYAPPRFDENSFRVRYILGVVDKEQDKKNELHLVVYGKGEKKALLYEVYFDRDARPSIYIGEMGTLKQEKGLIEPDEIWGGVGTYRQVKRLLRLISARPAVTVSATEVVAGHRACVFQR